MKPDLISASILSGSSRAARGFRAAGAIRSPNLLYKYRYLVEEGNPLLRGIVLRTFQQSSFP